jgi:hypothetical protein
MQQLLKQNVAWLLVLGFALSCTVKVFADEISPPSLDLTSTGRGAQSSATPAFTTAILTVGNVSRTVTPTDLLTPAEQHALTQLILTGQQSLLLNNLGAATGGTLNVSSLATELMQSLIIPSQVTVVHDFGTKATLNIAESLTNAGRLIAFSSKSDMTLATINAARIFNQSGGLISSIVPADLTSLNAVVRNLDLSLNALHDIVNEGVITSSGALSVKAGGSILNVPARSPVAPAPVMQALSSVSLSSALGSIVNQGTINSIQSNVTIGTPNARDFLLDNTGGELVASNGSVNIMNQAAGKQLTEVTGGDVRSLDLNISGADGMVKAAFETVTGTMNIDAGSAHISTKHGNLSVGRMELSGDPTIANSGGNVTLSSDLIFHGQHLAILASENIQAANPFTIDVSSTTGNGGDVHLIAGYNFTPSTTGQVQSAQTYTIGSPSSTGGDVSLFGVDINTSSSAGNGGKVVAVGHKGTVGHHGAIRIGSIDTSSTAGFGGSVTMIGKGGMHLTGDITTFGLIEAGSVTAITAAPKISGGTVSFTDGTRSGSGFFTNTSSFGPVETTAINIFGNINAFSGAFVGGEVILISSGYVFTFDIDTSGGILGIGPGPYDGGRVELISALDHVNVGGINTSGGASSSASPGGNGGNVQIGANTHVTLHGPLTTRGGNNTGSGNGGNGGLFNVTIPATTDFTSVFVDGTVDTRGGNATGGGNGGDGGHVTLVADSFSTFGGPPLVTGGTGATPGQTGELLVIDPVLLPQIVQLLQSLEAQNATTNAANGTITADRTATVSTIIATDANFEQRQAKLVALDQKKAKEWMSEIARRTGANSTQNEDDNQSNPNNMVVIATGETDFDNVKSRLARGSDSQDGRTPERAQALADTASTMFKVTGGQGDFVLFSVANQVFTGDLGGSREVVLVGDPGTSLTKGDTVVLHTGKVFVDTGNEPMKLHTRLGTVTISKQSSAIVESEPGKPIRVLATSTESDGEVSLQHGEEQPISLKSGEQAVVSDKDLTEEELISVDGKTPALVSGGVHMIGRKAAKMTASVEVLDREMMIAGRVIRLSGAGRAVSNRIARHSGNSASWIAAKASQSGSATQQSNDALQMLATENSRFIRDKQGNITLEKGNFFFGLPAKTAIKTSMAEVSGVAGALVTVEKTTNAVRIKSCSGPEHVNVKVGDKTLNLNVGQEMLITDHIPSKPEMLPEDGIGRRSLTTYSIDDHTKAVVGDFSMISFLKNSDQMTALRSGSNGRSDQLLARLVKTAAAVHMTSGHKGRFYSGSEK